MLEIKKHCNRNENAFDGLIRLDTNEESNSELENISIESLKTIKQREQRLRKKKKKKTEYPWAVG